jgi:L-alanine-DL-glutamate epimerase-like enolase superfamily enzyme
MSSVTVRAIEPIILRYPEPNDFNNMRMTVLVRLETSAGGVGWGEGIAMWPEACRATAAIVSDGFAPLLAGHPVAEIGAAWWAMKRHAWWYGEGGIAGFAHSAIDMALWDALGHETGRSVGALLGGIVQPGLPANATMHVNKATLDENIAEIAGHIAAGFRSVKLGLGKRGLARIGPEPESVIGFVTALRRALGPVPGIMVDVGNGIRWDPPTAIRVARALEPLEVGWIEEPLYPADIEGYRRLRAATRLPIASGEREWTVEGYKRLLATETVDVFGIDPGRAEGVTGFQAVARLVEAAHRQVNAHAFSTAVTTAASLHLSAATPASRIFELKPHASPMQHELVRAPIGHEGGLASPPSGPGLGIDVDERVVAKYRVA